ncbi:MAG: hypothetical protein K0R15_2097 [Clostridiales bacterium]|jgi:hypothetical protein|nr:hypothetical protein [Clostridiales bacterium]
MDVKNILYYLRLFLFYRITIFLACKSNLIFEMGDDIVENFKISIKGVSFIF